MISVGQRIPDKNKGILLSTGTAKQKIDMLAAAEKLHEKGYKLYATGGTHKMLASNGIPSTLVAWPAKRVPRKHLTSCTKKRLTSW